MTQVIMQENGKTLVAKLSGEIDHHGAERLRAQIDERISTIDPAILILNFSAVTFMDSSGIGLILGRHKLVNAGGGILIVEKAPKEIRRMLTLAGIDAKD